MDPSDFTEYEMELNQAFEDRQRQRSALLGLNAISPDPFSIEAWLAGAVTLADMPDDCLVGVMLELFMDIECSVDFNKVPPVWFVSEDKAGRLRYDLRVSSHGEEWHYIGVSPVDALAVALRSVSRNGKGRYSVAQLLCLQDVEMFCKAGGSRLPKAVKPARKTKPAPGPSKWDF